MTRVKFMTHRRVINNIDVKLEIPMFLYKKGIKYTQIMHVFLSVILNNAQKTLGQNTTYRQVKSNL